MAHCFAIMVGVKIVIVSGYFNPLHGGHLDMIEAARKIGDELLVIVNNDVQQVLKKGKVILDEANRMRLITALRDVDETILSIDKDPAQKETLQMIARKHPSDALIFANGGDRDGERAIPETDICKQLGIELVFGVGSHDVVKRDSSTRINQALGHKK